MRFRSRGSALISVIVAVGGCSGGEGTAPEPPVISPVPGPRPPSPDALDQLYSREHLLEIAIELAPADWEQLRGEGRGLIEGFLGPGGESFEYTEFNGTASVDGQRYTNVSIRKKGYLGSLSRPRPSLKLDFGEVEAATGAEAGRVFERLTLNNNRGDNTRARTCLAYDLFAKAGVPAPRCNLAHVVVNGEDLGTYSNVEPIKKPMLARNFGDDTGNLYEGQLIDLVEQDEPKFELKTNEQAAERSDLHRLIAAAGASSPFPERLAELLDIERFRDFWAMETLTGHWDGYAGNRNNFYLYDNPATGRFEFIPWGTDGAFTEGIPGDAVNTGQTVLARALLANRLYALPDQRALFRARLSALNDAVWDGGALVRELQRIEALAPDALPEATAALAEHLETHGNELRAALRSPAPDWVQLDDAPSPCAGAISELRFEFATDYGALEGIELGLGRFSGDLSLDGASFVVPDSAWFGRAGVENPRADTTVTLRALGFLDDGRGVLLQISIPPEEFSPGVRSLHGFETAGLIVALRGADSRFVGFISDGTLALDAASAVSGAPVEGRLEGKLFQLACAGLD